MDGYESREAGEDLEKLLRKTYRLMSWIET
jgi:hypothetical protein